MIGTNKLQCLNNQDVSYFERKITNMVINGKKFEEVNITKDGELIVSIADGEHGIVHKDDYTVQLVVEEIGMTFSEAFKAMKAGAKVKLPSWGGYWFWDAEKQSIMMQCRPKDTDKGQGDLLDIRETQRVEYTLSNILSDEWLIADETNCPVLGGEATFGFGDAIKYVKRGLKVKRKGWNGKNQYIQLATGISYKTADKTIVNCDHEAIGNKAVAFAVAFVGTSGVQMGWLASQADMLAEDWMFVD